MTRPRIGFLGTGWIGRHRMEAMIATNAIEAAAIADPSPAMRDEALALAPGARIADGLDALLALDLDGIVIATPSALHADQAIAALEAGAAVFCQKPLGRDAAEAARVVAAAHAADRLLAVDFSYRHTAAMQAIAPLVRDGALGQVFAIDLVFHNAYGPDKPWFYDRTLSGGGCVMDLGVHLVDLALSTLGFPALDGPMAAQLLAGGQTLSPSSGEVEDYAAASFTLAGGVAVRLACSWRLQAGREAVIGAQFYGTEGGAGFRNRNGSFFDFVAERYAGTDAAVIASPPDDWGGRAVADWARRLAGGQRFDPAANEIVAVARVLDAIYAA